MSGGLCATHQSCHNGPLRHVVMEGCSESAPFRRLPPAGVPGMGPDAPVETNSKGGSQSVIPFTFTTMPLRALAELSKLQHQGDAKYGAHNWRKIPESDHINHAFAHLLAHSLGDTSDDHLVHAAWRLLAAIDVQSGRPDPNLGRETA